MKLLNSIAVASFLGLSLFSPEPSSSQEINAIWSPIIATNQVNLGDSFLIDLNSIKRPGDGDDFWHVKAKGPNGIISTYSFDCYTDSYFPNGEAPSKQVKTKTIEKSLMMYVCTPPSQIEKLKESLAR